MVRIKGASAPFFMEGEMITLIGGIINEGLKFLNEKNRTRFMVKYHNTLKKLRDAENASGDDYTDIDIDLSEEEIRDILTAFRKELKDAK